MLVRASTAPVRCALCHSDLDDTRTTCASCGTVLHGSCRATLAGCPTLGCARRFEAEDDRQWPGLTATINGRVGPILERALGRGQERRLFATRVIAVTVVPTVVAGFGTFAMEVAWYHSEWFREIRVWGGVLFSPLAWAVLASFGLGRPWRGGTPARKLVLAILIVATAFDVGVAAMFCASDVASSWLRPPRAVWSRASGR